MMPTEHIFEAGHRIGIVIVAGTASSGIPTSASPAQPITLDTRASKVSLPIVGGTAAMTETGAFTDPTAPVGGTVPATLALTLGTPARSAPSRRHHADVHRVDDGQRDLQRR